jgi:hypothetical protein
VSEKGGEAVVLKGQHRHHCIPTRTRIGACTARLHRLLHCTVGTALHCTRRKALRLHHCVLHYMATHFCHLAAETPAVATVSIAIGSIGYAGGKVNTTSRRTSSCSYVARTRPEPLATCGKQEPCHSTYKFKHKTGPYRTQIPLLNDRSVVQGSNCTHAGATGSICRKRSWQR